MKKIKMTAFFVPQWKAPRPSLADRETVKFKIIPPLQIVELPPPRPAPRSSLFYVMKPPDDGVL